MNKRVGVLAVVISLSLLFLVQGCSDDKKSSKPSSSNSSSIESSKRTPAAPVGYIEISFQSTPIVNKIPGRVVPFQVAEVRPQVSGIVQKRMFTEGSIVEEGEQLYQIEPNRYQADFESAQASYNNAQARVENAQSVVNRYDSLAASDVLSQQAFDDAETELTQAEASLAQAQAQLKTARINLAYTKVYAPITGFISPSNVTKGALVSQQQEQPLATIRQLDPVYVDLSLSANDQQQMYTQLINSGIRENESSETVTLFLGSDEPYAHEGKLQAADLAVDNQTGTIRLRAVFPNPDNVLLPGLFVRGAIQDDGANKVVIVPQKSVKMSAKGAKHVWLIDSDAKARKREVTTGSAFENKWIVKKGLNEGDRLIVEGTMMLQEGQPVKPELLNANRQKETQGQKAEMQGKEGSNGEQG